MFNLAKSKEYEDLTITNVLKYLTQEQIYEHYFGQSISLTDKYKNPLRQDESPGCQFFYSTKSNKLLFNDFSLTSPPIDCFDFIKLKYNYDLNEALMQINHDFKLKLGSSEISGSPVAKKVTVKPIKREPIRCQPQNFNNFDKKYWNEYGITLSTLSYFNVYAIKKVWKGRRPVWTYSPGNPIYCYRFPIENKKKLYRPLAKRSYKFMSSPGIKHVYQGYDQLPSKADRLIITKSMKDVMLLYELGYYAIAPNGEGYDIPNEFINELYSRFDELILFYDNDEVGIKNADDLCKKIGCSYIYIPEEYGEKDISDFYKKYGLVDTLTLMKKLLND